MKTLLNVVSNFVLATALTLSFLPAVSADSWSQSSFNEGSFFNTTTTTGAAEVQLTLTTRTVTSDAAGGYHSLGIRADGTLWTWGNNGYWQLGNGGSPSLMSSPTQIGTAVNWTKVEGGGYHSLALKANGTLWSWGRNYDGELGLGDTTQRSTPVQVGTVTTWVKVASTYLHNLAVRSNGTLWAWGYGAWGQLGYGGTSTKTSPTQVGTATNWAEADTGAYHSLALKTTGTLWAWGYNYYGQLGDGTTTQRNSPVQIGTLTTWSKVAGGWHHSLAVKSDGTLWAWGRNNYGQLGLGDTTQRNSPVQVGTATNWVGVAAGEFHSLALKSNGTLYAWGRNYYGQLGLGDTTQRTLPVQVGTLTTWSKISAGESHSLGLKTDGTVWAWGRNNSGQLGDGTTTQRTSPVQTNITTRYYGFGTFTSTAIAPPDIYRWGVLNYTKNTPANTALTVDVLRSSNNALLVANVPSGTDLYATYPATFTGVTGIKLRANFSAPLPPSTSQLLDWSVSYFTTLAAPSVLTATAVSSSQINLTWQDNSNNEDGYKVWRSEIEGGLYGLVETLQANSTTYSDTGLQPSTTYYYVVSAFNFAGESANSNEASATTSDDTTPPPSNLCSISIDNGSLATSSTNVTLTLSAQDPESNIVWMRFSNDNIIWSDWVEYTTTISWTLTEGDGEKTVYVQYKNSADLVSESVLSSIILTTIPPNAPTNLIATAISSSQIYLIWTDNSDNEQWFIIESKLNDWGDFVQIAIVGADTISYSDTSVLTGINHTYRIRAFNIAGNSAYSNIASAIPPGEITYDGKVATGTALIATFRPADWNSVTIAAVQTPEPYEPYGDEDNRVAVSTTTPGALTLYYTDETEQTIQVNRTIDINNITQAISYGGSTVTILQEIFGGLDPAPAGDFMCLLMNFPYVLTIYMTPVSHNQPQASILKFKTDNNKEIKPWPVSEDPRTPQERIDEWDIKLRNWGLTPTDTSRRPGAGVITPTVITPTTTHNCHGWTFACGSGWVGPTGPEEVETIISDNDYALVTVITDVHVGALVVYRKNGKITHTGVVREVQKADGTRSSTYCNYGTPTLVESKLREGGRYLHPPEKVPPGYLPPDDPETHEREGIEYWSSPRPSPPGSPGRDPGKEHHTLLPG